MGKDKKTTINVMNPNENLLDNEIPEDS